jgi:homogentisate 1,2-dioxygenase
MPYYTKLGEIPKKRHVQFRRPDGALYSEEVFGTEGFVGPTSTLYHIHPPTQVSGWEAMYSTKTEFVETDVMRMRHIKTQPVSCEGDIITGQKVILGNADVEMAVCVPAEQMGYHYKNGQGDECWFVHYGSGTVYTMFGAAEVREEGLHRHPQGDHLQVRVRRARRRGPPRGRDEGEHAARQARPLRGDEHEPHRAARPATSPRPPPSSSSIRPTANATSACPRCR